MNAGPTGIGVGPFGTGAGLGGGVSGAPRCCLPAGHSAGCINAQGLTAAQEERLVLIMEEAGEVVQACAKILRHGFESRSPVEVTFNNKTKLAHEVGNFLECVALAVARGDILPREILEGQEQKTQSLARYARHQQT